MQHTEKAPFVGPVAMRLGVGGCWSANHPQIRNDRKAASASPGNETEDLLGGQTVSIFSYIMLRIWLAIEN